MTLQLVSRSTLNLFRSIPSTDPNGMAFIESVTLPNQPTKSFAFVVILTELQKEQIPKVPVVSQNLNFRFGNLDNAPAGVAGDPDNVHSMAAASKSIVIRSGLYTISNGVLLESEGVYVGPGNASPRDDMYFYVRELAVYSGDSPSDFDDLWGEGITLLSSHEAADVETEITDKLDTLLQHHSNGVKVGSYVSGVKPTVDTVVITAANRIVDMVTGAGSSTKFLAYALQDAPAPDTLSIASAVDARLSATHGSGSWATANLSSLSTAVAAIPTNPLLTNDSRLDNLGQDVTVGGYATGQSPADLVDFTATNNAIAAIPTNPLLANDSRLDFVPILDAIASVQSTVNAIPANPLLTSDARLDNLDAPISTPAIVAGYLPGVEPPTVEQIGARVAIDLASDFGSLSTAIGTRLASADYVVPPTTSEIDTELTSSHGAGSWTTGAGGGGSVTVAGYAAGQSPQELLASRLNAIDSAIAAVPSVAQIDAWLTGNHGAGSWTTGAGTDHSARFDALDTAIAAIPTNPFLANDARIDSLSTFDPSATDVVASNYRTAGMTLVSFETMLNAIGAGVSAIPTNPLLAVDPRLDYLDAPISAPVIVGGYTGGASPTVDLTATNALISAIPTNPLLTNDARLDHLDADISASVTVGGYEPGQSPADLVDLSGLTTAVGAIPTNPLLAVDARLDNLDAAITTRLASASYTAPDNSGIADAKSAAETIRDARTLPATSYATDSKQDTILSQLDGVASGVSARLVVITTNQYALPTSGSTPYSILIQSNDAAGQPVNLDTDALPVVTAFAGAVDRSSKLSVVTKQSTGRYSLTYTVDFDDTEPESLTITATGTQSSTAYSAEDVVTISDSAATDYTLADRARDDAIQTTLDAVNAAIGGLSTFDASTDSVTVGGYVVGQAPDDLVGAVDLTATNAAIAAVQTGVDAIPTNPLLANDARIDAFSTFDPSSDAVQLDLTQLLSNGQTLDTALTNVGSLGGGPNKLTVTAVDENSAVVPNVIVDLLDSNGDRLGIYGLTDFLGVAEFSVAAASYQLTIRSTPGLSLASPLAVTVGGDTASTLNLKRTSTTLPVVTGMCVVDDYVLDSQFNPVENAIITATVSSNAVLQNPGIATQIRAQTVSDSTGRFQLRLPRKDQFTEGAMYTITVQSASGASIYRSVTGVIPNQNSCLLKDIENVLS